MNFQILKTTKKINHLFSGIFVSDLPWCQAIVEEAQRGSRKLEKNKLEDKLKEARKEAQKGSKVSAERRLKEARGGSKRGGSRKLEERIKEQK